MQEGSGGVMNYNTGMKKNITIIGSGNVDENYLKEFDKGHYIISVDRASVDLIDKGIIPDISIGDFDSVSESELEIIEKNVKKIIRYHPEKDETDLELAIIYSIRLLPNEVIIRGATGKRLDHELANIYLLKRYLDKHINAHIIDPNNKITLIDKKTIINKDKRYKYLSLIPYTEKAIVSISGCKYNVSRKALLKESSRGVSNEIIDSTAKIEVHEGVLIIIQSKD